MAPPPREPEGSAPGLPVATGPGDDARHPREERLNAALRDIVAGTNLTGQRFFDGLAVNLARALGARWVLVGEKGEGDPPTVETLALCVDGSLQPALEYGLPGTPCAHVLEDGAPTVCHHRQGVADLFPEDLLLRELGASAYIGVPLTSSSGRVVGILAAMHDRPLDESLDPATVLLIFAGRASAELERLQRDRALAESDERLRLALESARMGTWEWDVVADSVARSRETWTEPERERGRLTFEAWLGLVVDEDRPAVRAAIQAALAGERDTVELEYRILEGGETRWMEARGRLHRDQQGRPARMAGVAANVTTRKVSEAALRESEQRWRTFSESACEGIGFTRGGVLIDASEQLAAMLRLPLPELIGLPMRAIVAPESQPVVEAHQRSGSGEPYEHWSLRGDGSVFPVEVRGREVLYRGIPTRMTVVRDVSERHRLRETLTLAAEEWRSCFDALPLGIVVVDHGGAVRRLNRLALALAGLSRFRDAVGRPLESLGSDGLWSDLSRLVRDPQPGDAVVSTAPEGRSYLVGAVTLPEAIHGGSTLLHFQDVTEIVHLRERLRTQETLAAIGSLVGGVAHEVRNPLFSISANIDALEARELIRPDQARTFEIIRREVQRLNTLMADLLEYGRPAEGERVTHAVDELIADAAQACQMLARSASVEVVTNLAPLPSVPMNPDRMRRALQNLIQNALQHAPAGTRVTVSGGLRGEGPGRRIECRVEDSGPGIAAADMPRLFDPFFSRRRGGIGLGLSLVQKIVTEHGGTVVAANRPEGGASFRVTLPSGPP